MTRLLRPTDPAQAQAWQACGAGCFIAGGTALQLAWEAVGGTPPAGLIAVDGLAQAQGVSLHPATQGRRLQPAHGETSQTQAPQTAPPDGQALPKPSPPTTEAAGHLRLGAALRLQALIAHPLVQQHAPALASACRQLAAPAVRQLATLGGNIGWRWGDTLPVLLVLDAELELAEAGPRMALARWLALAEPPLIVAVWLPLVPAQAALGFEKVGHRAAFSPSRLSLAWRAVVPAAGGLSEGRSPGAEAASDGHRPHWRVAACAAGLPARRLLAAELCLSQAAPGKATLAQLSAACLADLREPALARLAARLILGDGPKHGAASDHPASHTASHVGPSPWPSAPRPDARAKLAGQAGYLTDRLAPGQLHGAILGSPPPHARIRRIDTRAALALPGVHAVITAADVPGQRYYGLRVVDRPVLCRHTVRCVGDPVAAVAADSPARAQQALALIEVDYELLPVVADAEAALESTAPALHPRGNLLHQASHAHGDWAEAEAACVHWVEAEYHSPVQMHAFLETEGGVAEPEADGGITLYFGGHNPERDRQVIAAVLALPPERVRVVATPVGGSFGGKDELTIQPIAALLAQASGRAVRLHLGRPQSVDLGVKRHAMRVRMRSGCNAQGRLLCHRVDVLADTGAYATHGPEVLHAAIEHASGPYAWQAVALQGRLAYTNNGIAGAMRGFGAVQVQWALEQQIHRLAQAGGWDAAEFRARNLAAADAPGPLGQAVLPFDGPARALAALRGHALWAEGGARSWAQGRWRHAVGLALVQRSDGFGRGGPNGGRFAIALAADGAIELRCSFTELGQNLLGSLQALGAQVLGCAAADLRPVVGDSALTPDSGAVAASRATSMAWRALHQAAGPWRAAMLAAASQVLQQPATGWQLAPGGLVDAEGALLVRYADLAAALPAEARPALLLDLPPEETPSDVPSAHWVFGACAAAAEVAVDTLTGAVRVLHYAVASALGPVVSPAGYWGQLEGGALIGQGLATCEQLTLDQGHYSARNLDGYLIPTLADAPAFSVLPVEALPEGDPVGPRGAGEIGVNIATPAIVNAVSLAVGAPITRLPMAPDALCAALDAAGLSPFGATVLADSETRR